MLPRHDRLSYVIGSPDSFSGRPLVTFAPEVRAFLAQLSERLLCDAGAKAFPDVVSFAWWCRKGNVERQAAAYEDGTLRLGRGVAFHVTPNNIPVNFAFSWVFSLLAGNANVVRLPERSFPQIPAILRHVEALFEGEPYREIGAMNAFVKYGREEEIAAAFSRVADIRILWGGDDTIRLLRRAPLPPRGVDVSFADRYAFCVLGASGILCLGELELSRLVSGFYNDTYLFDQNACSSPHLVVWLGSADEVCSAQDRFWDSLQAEVVRRYELAPVSAVDKLTQACRDAIELEGCVAGLEHARNDLYRLRLERLFAGIENRRCGCGYFYEYITKDIDDVAPVITSKFQTVTCHGVERALLASFVARHRTTGIDRIVPVGAAMDIGLIWDGYDLIRTLSRICHVG